MEVLIDCYFDRFFAELERSSLASRHKRRQLVNYFSDVINSCAEAENLDKSDVCRRVVEAALRYHNISLVDNGSVCMLGKFHNVLYIAAKLCFDWELDNNEVVARVLNDIFYCEQTFERIFVGAILGTRVTYFLSGWKSDFEDQNENIRALVYFMNHAITAKLEYRCPISNRKRRFIDVCMESYGQTMPLRVAIQNAAPDILLTMLRYGASCEADELAPAPIESLLSKLKECETDCAIDEKAPVYPQHLVACLKLLLRTIPVVYVQTPSHIASRCGVSSVFMYEQYPELAKDHLVPPERSGLCPPELTHLCRCKIRERLNENWALPHGIRDLRIPETLKDYLDLLSD